MLFPQTFRQTSSIGTFKRANKERMCCRVTFSEEFTAVFGVKASQIDNDDDKNPKLFPVFKAFMHFFYIILTEFVAWNVETGQQLLKVLFSMLRKEINAILQTKTVRN